MSRTLKACFILWTLTLSSVALSKPSCFQIFSKPQALVQKWLNQWNQKTPSQNLQTDNHFQITFKSAQQGDVKSQLELANIYYVKEMFEEALNWFVLAYKGGHPKAQLNIEYMIKQNLGHPDKLEEAKNILKELAPSENNRLAQTYYIQAKNLEKTNPEQAIPLFLKALEAKHPQAQKSLAQIYYNLAQSQKHGDQAISWLIQALEMNHPKAKQSLADAYYNLAQSQKHIDQMILWLVKALEMNHPEAKQSLADAYYNKGSLESVKWWEKAAQLDHPVAQEVLKLLNNHNPQS